jgi:hypothetical protein
MKKRNYLILLLSALLIGFIGCQPANGQTHYVENGKIYTELSNGSNSFDNGMRGDPWVGCDDGTINGVPYVLAWTSKGRAYVIKCNPRGDMNTKREECWGARVTDMKFTGDSQAIMRKNGKRYKIKFNRSGGMGAVSQIY